MIYPLFPLARFFSIGRLMVGATAFLVFILSLSVPFFIMLVYSSIIPEGIPDIPQIWVLVLCIAILVETIMRLCLSYVRMRDAARQRQRREYEAFNRLLQTGHHMRDLFYAHDDTGTGTEQGRYSGLYIKLSFTGIYLGLIACMIGPLVFVPLAVLVVFIGAIFFKAQGLDHALHRQYMADSKRNQFISEAVKGLHSIKSFALEKQFQRRYDHIQKESGMAASHVAEKNTGLSDLFIIFYRIMAVCVITTSVFPVLQGHITIAALIAAVILSLGMTGTVGRLVEQWADYPHKKSGSEKTEEAPFISATVHETGPQPVYGKKKEGAIRIENLHVNGLFRNVDLDVEPGEAIRISGMDGTGKSTLLKVIAGLCHGDGGNILIDGYNIQDYTPDELASHIGYIPERHVIFRGTIRDNITRFGAVSQEDADHIVSLLGIGDEIAQLPRGYSTWLDGDNHDNGNPFLPAGLCRRIALARILVTRPRIILVDNESGNPDPKTYREMCRILGRLKQKVALLMVTDDQNLTHLATRHMVLSSGGLHEILIGEALDPYFQELRA